MRAVIYCRVSTKEQTQNLSIPTQRRACNEYCARHGLTVAREFVDAGESAKTADRPELKAMLAYCRHHKGQIQALVVYNVSRFARDR
jgi:site-specific DNA recombinase